MTGVWLAPPPRKIASIGVHVSRWVTTHGYALNVDLDPQPFTEWITACGLEDAAFTTMARELGRPLTVDDVRPAAAAALAEVFDLALTSSSSRRAVLVAGQPRLRRVEARLLLEPIERFAHVPERGPRVRGAARRLVAAEVLGRDAAVAGGPVELAPPPPRRAGSVVEPRGGRLPSGRERTRTLLD